MSPTQRTLHALRERGYFVEKVERRVPFRNVTQDLFGWIDVVAVHPEKPGVLGVQCTTGGNAASRLKKAKNNGALLAWLLASNSLVVHAWGKRKTRLASGKWSKRTHWELREIPLERGQIVDEVA